MQSWIFDETLLLWPINIPTIFLPYSTSLHCSIGPVLTQVDLLLTQRSSPVWAVRVRVRVHNTTGTHQVSLSCQQLSCHLLELTVEIELNIDIEVSWSKIQQHHGAHIAHSLLYPPGPSIKTAVTQFSYIDWSVLLSISAAWHFSRYHCYWFTSIIPSQFTDIWEVILCLSIILAACHLRLHSTIVCSTDLCQSALTIVIINWRNMFIMKICAMVVCILIHCETWIPPNWG